MMIKLKRRTKDTKVKTESFQTFLVVKKSKDLLICTTNKQVTRRKKNAITESD
jgi:hypothetical protein